MPSPRISPMKWLLASGWKPCGTLCPRPGPCQLSRGAPARAERLLAARDVDGDAGHEVGVGGGEEADHPGLVLGSGDPPERSPADLRGLGLGRAPVPVGADALG